ncbi:MAG: hypothetical protein ACK5Q5_24780 [Planctomycetaceae bacterium]
MDSRRSIFWAILALTLIGGLLARLPSQRLEHRLLRMGGGVVSKLAQRPGRTAAWFAAALGVAWAGVAVATISQRRR